MAGRIWGNVPAQSRLHRPCSASSRSSTRDTLARYRRLYGPDHPSTLTFASNLAVNLRKRVLGEEHPHTQSSVRNLAADLRALEE